MGILNFFGCKIPLPCSCSVVGTTQTNPAPENQLFSFHQLASGVSIPWCWEHAAAVGHCWIGCLEEGCKASWGSCFSAFPALSDSRCDDGFFPMKGDAALQVVKSRKLRTAQTQQDLNSHFSKFECAALNRTLEPAVPHGAHIYWSSVRELRLAGSVSAKGRKANGGVW